MHRYTVPEPVPAAVDVAVRVVALADDVGLVRFDSADCGVLAGSRP